MLRNAAKAMGAIVDFIFEVLTDGGYLLKVNV
jgi:hypothetical protein